jgi:formamidopyrimidine-DNA glycosylase
MPEIPEISCRAKEMKTGLSGMKITSIDVLQPKSLNIPVDEFMAALCGATFLDIYHRGKWIVAETSQGFLLLNLGMGGEILLTTQDNLPEKRRLVFYLEGESGRSQPCLSINFWWFGYAHYADNDRLEKHEMTAKLGPNATDVTLNEFKNMLAGQRSRIKSFLLDQSHLAGIGNAYIHDILFLARLHPLRPINSLAESDIEALFHAIRAVLEPSIAKGGAFYEVNLYGEKGGFLFEDILVGYREGQPCPECSTTIEKIKTGSTASFICPRCQAI